MTFISTQTECQTLINVALSLHNLDPYNGVLELFEGLFTHCFGLRVPEEDIDEGDHLQSLAEAHAVCQDATKATGDPEARQRLDEVIVQETDTANLQGDQQGD